MLLQKEKKSPSKSKSVARSVGAESSSITDRTDAAVELVSEFIIEDKVERSVPCGEWEDSSVMAASMSSAVIVLLGVVMGVEAEEHWVYVGP